MMNPRIKLLKTRRSRTMVTEPPMHGIIYEIHNFICILLTYELLSPKSEIFNSIQQKHNQPP